MPHPKRRHSATRRDKRRNAPTRKPKAPNVSVCSNCGSPILSHHACESCGYYHGKPALTPKAG